MPLTQWKPIVFHFPSNHIAHIVHRWVLLTFALNIRRQAHIHGETSNALLNGHLERGGEKSEKDGIIKRKSNLSFEASIDPGERCTLKGSGQWSRQRAACECGRNRGVNKHQSDPLEGTRGARWKDGPLQIKKVTRVFTSSNPSVIVTPPPAPPSPPSSPQPGASSHTPLLPQRHTNVTSFVDPVRFRSSPLSLCSGLILLWATVDRAHTQCLPSPREGPSF